MSAPRANECGLRVRRAIRGLRSVPLRGTPLRPRHPESARGFTLVEILVVIGIIAVLVSIVLAVGSALGQSTEIKQTQATMAILERALSEWEKAADRQLTWGTNDYLGNGNFFQGASYDMQVFEPGPPGNQANLRKHLFLISELLATIGRSTEVQTILVQIDDRVFITYNSAGSSPRWIADGADANFRATEPDPNAGGWVSEYQSGRWDGYRTVLDAWERPIRFVHPGDRWIFGNVFGDPDPDADGTVTTPFELAYGIARQKGYFVSAGRDGKFGDVDPDPSDPDREAKLKAAQDNVYSGEVIKP